MIWTRCTKLKVVSELSIMMIPDMTFETIISTIKKLNLTIILGVVERFTDGGLHQIKDNFLYKIIDFEGGIL